MIVRLLPTILLLELCAICTSGRMYQSQALCPLPRIAHGSTVYRQRGKLVRFKCDATYELHGNVYVECKAGKWQTPIPMCLKSGCPELTHPTGVLSLSETKTSVTLFCHPNYVVVGAPIAYCDGERWDRALGSCREIQIGPATWCDFDADTCGWTADALHDYEWRRTTGIPLTSNTHGTRLGSSWRTGPQHDHTTGVPLEGFFMLAKTGDQQQHDLARMVSPLYTAEQGADACFRLYYHMYGRQVGRLRVYVKPIGVLMEDVLLDTRHVLFEMIGNQKNEWKVALVSLEQQSTEFQIVVEASAGGTKSSDIGVDDVALLWGADCRTEEDSIVAETTPAEEMGGVFDVATCAGRCEQSRSSSVYTDLEGGGLFLNCDCTAGCIDTLTCCADYLSACVFTDKQSKNTTDSTVADSIVNHSDPSHTSTTAVLPTTQTSTSTVTSTSTTTPRPSTVPTSSTSTTSTSKPTTLKTTPTTPRLTIPTTASVLTTTKQIPTQKTLSANTAKITQVPSTQKTTKRTSTSSSATTTETSTTTKQITSTESAVTVDTRTTSPTKLTTTNYLWRSQQPINQIHDRKGAISMWGIISVLLVLCSAIAVVKWRGALIHQMRRHRVVDDEYSDVRFLVEDDDAQLDFKDKEPEKRS